MLLLCSNDDGILAAGLACLEQAAKMLGDVFVVAPDREQSATSHSLTLHHPLRPVLGKRGFDGIAICEVSMNVDIVRVRREARQARLFQVYVVVVTEIVEPDDLVAALE